MARALPRRRSSTTVAPRFDRLVGPGRLSGARPPGLRRVRGGGGGVAGPSARAAAGAGVARTTPARSATRPPGPADVHPGVALLLVGAREPLAADLALEWLLAGVRANVRGEMVGAGEGPEAGAALERLLACVDADVARQLVGAGEAAVTGRLRTRVGPLSQRRPAGSRRAPPWPDRPETRLRRRLRTPTAGSRGRPGLRRGRNRLGGAGQGRHQAGGDWHW